MPRPDAGSDVYIYNALDFIVPTFCKFNIHPNAVTGINILLSGIFYRQININDKNFFIIFSLIVGRTILDCLDGEVARQCDKRSTFGSHIDTLSDFIFMSIFFTYMLPIDFKIKNILFLGILFYILANKLFKFDSSTHEMGTPIAKLWHDNTILKSLIMCVIYYYKCCRLS